MNFLHCAFVFKYLATRIEGMKNRPTRNTFIPSLLLLSIILTSNSCSIFQSKGDKASSGEQKTVVTQQKKQMTVQEKQEADRVAEKKRKEKEVMNDLVSIQTTLDLVRASFVRGCIQARAQLKVKKGSSFEHCTKMAKLYVKNEVMYFLTR